MLGAGIVAKKAVEKGLTVPPYVKTSLATTVPIFSGSPTFIMTNHMKNNVF